ncbi:MAG: hypothetical protein H7836_17915 [Magnetococcus sp. YQC-3]
MRVVECLIFVFVVLGVVLSFLGFTDFGIVCYLVVVGLLLFYVKTLPENMPVVVPAPVPSVPLSLPKVEPGLERKVEQRFVGDSETEIVFGKPKVVK